jgi:tRNA A37 methylthiotransferase MiaB
MLEELKREKETVEGEMELVVSDVNARRTCAVREDTAAQLRSDVEDLAKRNNELMRTYVVVAGETAAMADEISHLGKRIARKSEQLVAANVTLQKLATVAATQTNENLLDAERIEEVLRKKERLGEQQERVKTNLRQGKAKLEAIEIEIQSLENQIPPQPSVVMAVEQAVQVDVISR